MGELARRFLELHVPGAPLLLANAWDAGSAKLLEHLGFRALATTSSGHAATLGRRDGTVTREEALAHGADLVRATALPVSADLEDGFAVDPHGVAETVRGAIAAGLAGASIEDATGREDDPIHPFDEAVARVRAAVAAASGEIVITARAENFLHGRKDLEDTLARLQAFGEAGADVVYAPGLSRAEDIARVVREAGRPVNVLARPGAPSVPELAELGVARVSVGGALSFAAFGAVVEASRELLEHGTYGFLELAKTGGAGLYGAFE